MLAMQANKCRNYAVKQDLWEHLTKRMNGMILLKA